jgi:hypothetical protein
MLLGSTHGFNSNDPIVMVSRDAIVLVGAVVEVAGAGAAVAVGGGGVGGWGVGWEAVPHAASRRSAVSAVAKRNARWAGL